jgi:fatty acid desaturase
MTHPATGKELIPPLWYALGAIVATPLVALCMVMAGILMILGWPFIPILCYFQRKEDISIKHNAESIRAEIKS